MQQQNLRPEAVDVSVMEKAIAMYMYPGTQRAFREVYFDFDKCENDHCPGGKIDLLSGAESNGEKPVVKIINEGSLQSLYLYSYGELKIPEVRLFGLRVPENEVPMSVLQPAEVIAFSEVTEANNHPVEKIHIHKK